MPIPSHDVARRFKFTTDYPIDQVAYKRTHSQVIPTAASLGDYTTITIAHGLPFIPLCFGSFSDDGFATSYDFGNYDRFFNPTYGQYTVRVTAVIESDATNIYIIAQNMVSARTFTFRVLAFAPTNIPDGTSVPATNTDRAFMLSTDFNYMKVYLADVRDFSADGISSFEEFSIPHQLGYIPNALVFSEEGGRVRAAGSEVRSGGTYGVDSIVTLDIANLYVSLDKLGAAGNVRYHYRIYLDA